MNRGMKARIGKFNNNRRSIINSKNNYDASQIVSICTSDILAATSVDTPASVKSLMITSAERNAS
jgi:hypothetical protein